MGRVSTHCGCGPICCDGISSRQKTKALAEHLCSPIHYGFSFWPWHPGCWHWHVISKVPFASAQLSLQYSFPSAGIQLQAGCAHLDVVFMGAPFAERALPSRRNCSLEMLDHGVEQVSVLLSEAHLSLPTPQHRTRGNNTLFSFAHYELRCDG